MSSQEVLRQQSAFQAFGDARDSEVAEAAAKGGPNRSSKRKGVAEAPAKGGNASTDKPPRSRKAKAPPPPRARQEQHHPPLADNMMMHPQAQGAPPVMHSQTQAHAAWRSSAPAPGVHQNYPPMYQLHPHGAPPMGPDANGHVPVDMNGIPLMNRMPHQHVGMPMMPPSAPNMSAVVSLSEIHGGGQQQRVATAHNGRKTNSRAKAPKGASTRATPMPTAQPGSSMSMNMNMNMGMNMYAPPHLQQQHPPAAVPPAKPKRPRKKEQKTMEEMPVQPQGYGIMPTMGVPMMGIQGMNHMQIPAHMQSVPPGEVPAPPTGEQPKRSRGRPKGKNSRIRPDGTKLKQKNAEVKNILEESFQRNFHLGKTPKGDELMELVNSTGLSKYEIQSWFGGRRFRLKKKEAERNKPQPAAAKRATKGRAGSGGHLGKGPVADMIGNGMSGNAPLGEGLGIITQQTGPHGGEQLQPDGTARNNSRNRKSKASGSASKSKKTLPNVQSNGGYQRINPHPAHMHTMMPTDQVRTAGAGPPGPQIPNGTHHAQHQMQHPSHPHSHYHAHNHQQLLYTPGLDANPANTVNALYHANGNLPPVGQHNDMSKVQHLDASGQLGNGTHQKTSQHMNHHHSHHVAAQQPSHTQVMPSNYLQSDARYQRHQVPPPMNGVLPENELTSSMHPFYHPSWVNPTPSSPQLLVPPGNKMVDLYDAPGVQNGGMKHSNQDVVNNNGAAWDQRMQYRASGAPWPR